MTDPTISTSDAAAAQPSAGGSPAAAHSTATFEALPLSKELRDALATMGYTHPTPVQLAVWEPATRGRDAVVQARTGTGKTAAFGMPIVDQIIKKNIPHVQAMVLCPTRELAIQVGREIEKLAQNKSVKVVPIYGGAPMPRQVEQLANGAQLVCGTPGRVLDHLRRGTLDAKHIKLIVLDESDEMLSMGFERELSAILELMPKERQTLLFSATVPPDIERMAKSRLKNPEFVTLSGDHIGALEIQHFVYLVAKDKVSALVRVIEVENPESAVVFCNTKDDTEAVAQALRGRGYDADWLNGDLAQNEREKVMSATQEGRLRFLVATDVAARGIDISHLTHVINYDFPMDAESYVHRTGRTGRAGRTGTAISLIAPKDVGGLYLLRLTYKIRPIEKQIPTEGELKTRAEADLVTMLADAFLAKKAHADDLALARRLLTHDQAEGILAGLLRDHLGARPDAADEAAAARRAGKPKRPAPRPEMPASPPPRAQAQAPQAIEAAPRLELAPRMEMAPRTEPTPAPETMTRMEPPPRNDRERRPRRDDDRRPRRENERDAPRPPAARGQRHADFVTWQPPEEPGDDQPIFAGGEKMRGELPPPNPPPRRREERPREERQVERLPMPESKNVEAMGDDADFAEVYVNVGRRDGARAGDLQRLLTEKGVGDKSDVRRIRVRDRNAFVSVRKTAVDRAIAALTGATIGTRVSSAEIAREKSIGEGVEMNSVDRAATSAEPEADRKG